MSDETPFFTLGDAAEDAGDFAAAMDAFKQGVQHGEYDCLNRLALMFDEGRGVVVDKAMAMRLYRKAWRKGPAGSWTIAANNIAILYREAGQHRAMFQWFRRAAVVGEDECYLDLAKCYRDGVGVAENPEQAVRCLRQALRADFIHDETAEEVHAMLNEFRPRAV